jgi:hypothetical protein
LILDGIWLQTFSSSSAHMTTFSSCGRFVGSAPGATLGYALGFPMATKWAEHWVPQWKAMGFH